MESVSDIWGTKLLWNTVGDWTLAFIAFLVTFTVLPLVKGYVGSRRRKWLQAGRELPVAIEVATLLVERTSALFLWAVALYIGATQLEFPGHIDRGLTVALVLTFWFQIGLWGMAAIRLAVHRRSARVAGSDPALAGSLDVIVFIGGLVVWSMAFLLALDNLGIEIKPLLAGLGIGGIAVALAVQTVLSDLMASMSIALDKPFVVGDSLAIDNLSGTVEHIGVKSTRLRSADGEQIVMSNADILKSRLRNFARMRERRSIFRFNVTYNTPPEMLRAIPPAVREIIEAQPNTRFDRCHFLNFTDWALQFEVVYMMTVADFGAYADTQQKVNLAIVERFRAMGVEFAVPSRPFFTAEEPPPE